MRRPVNKRGHHYNPDRSNWKKVMAARRKRLEAAPKPPMAFVCTAMCFAYLDPPGAK